MSYNIFGFNMDKVENYLSSLTDNSQCLDFLLWLQCKCRMLITNIKCGKILEVDDKLLFSVDCIILKEKLRPLLGKKGYIQKNQREQFQRYVNEILSNLENNVLSNIDELIEFYKKRPLGNTGPSKQIVNKENEAIVNFDIPVANSKNESVEIDRIIEKIPWLKGKTNFVYLIDKLGEHGFIPQRFDKDKFIVKHFYFVENNNHESIKSIRRQTKDNLLNPSNEIIKIFEDLLALVNEATKD